MYACIERGMRTDGILPGGLKVQRRAFQVHQAAWWATPIGASPTRWRRWTG